METTNSSPFSPSKKDLEELFKQVPPGKLKKSIHKIFSNYLQTINNETDLEEFKLLSDDFYFLYKFLEKVEDGTKEWTQ